MLKQKTKPKGTVFFISGKVQGIEIERNKTIKKNTTHLISYGDETVGFSRFYTAKQAGVDVDRAISVPFECVENLRRDMALEMRSYRTGKVEYHKIVQVQEKHDTVPPSLLLSLKEILVTLEDEREEKERMSAL